MHLNHLVGDHLDSIQTNLQRLDRTITDLSHVQAAAVRNTEQFSRLFYGLYVTLAGAKFIEAPDATALVRLKQLPTQSPAKSPAKLQLLAPPLLPAPPSPQIIKSPKRAPRYRPLPPDLAVAKFASTSRIQRPTSVFMSRPKTPQTKPLGRFFTPLKMPRFRE